MAGLMIDRFVVAPQRATSDVESAADRHGLVEALKETPDRWSVDVPDLDAEGSGWTRPTAVNEFEIEVDEDGTVIVSDRLGATYGMGATARDAYVAWREAAFDLYHELAAEEAALHERLHDQLLFLRKHFG